MPPIFYIQGTKDQAHPRPDLDRFVYSTAVEAETPEGIDAYRRYEDCIECGLCVSACPVVVTAERYVGPAALAWAERVVEEPARGPDDSSRVSHHSAPCRSA